MAGLVSVNLSFSRARARASTHPSPPLPNPFLCPYVHSFCVFFQAFYPVGLVPALVGPPYSLFRSKLAGVTWVIKVPYSAPCRRVLYLCPTAVVVWPQLHHSPPARVPFL